MSLSRRCVARDRCDHVSQAVGKSNLGAGTAEFQIIKSLQSTQNEQRVAMLASILQRFKFFHLFSESQVQELAGVAVLTTMAEGDFLFKQDEIPDAVYVMLSGRCNLTKGESQKVSSVATEGDAVGDINHLDDRRRRNFTAQIVSNVAEVVVLRGEDLDKLYRKWQRQEERDLIQVLAEVPGFSSISHTNLQKLVFFFEKKKYSEGEIIYRQQDESQFFFVVCEGSVEVIKTVTLQRSSKVKKPHTHVKKNLEITTLSRSEFFGELEIFNDLPRTCTVSKSTK
uniref:Cyclic nucleotide-binding domain-containing protein n=1 Tax=Hanusia phi TaxID=3032 RepID=A0A7S0NES7_9CRYP|mmetsp:Transcript_8616/g.19497  ORF Transcript_8616/g.19497 Transcript_8616/m.19497 type:complete len:283 (+) Transcript_8616:1133-1981(+)